jgi:hypothetical protein
MISTKIWNRPSNSLPQLRHTERNLNETPVPKMFTAVHNITNQHLISTYKAATSYVILDLIVTAMTICYY